MLHLNSSPVSVFQQRHWHWQYDSSNLPPLYGDRSVQGRDRRQTGHRLDFMAVLPADAAFVGQRSVDRSAYKEASTGLRAPQLCEPPTTFSLSFSPGHWLVRVLLSPITAETDGPCSLLLAKHFRSTSHPAVEATIAMRVTSVTTLCLAFAASGAVHAVPLHHGAEAFASRRDGSSDPALSSTADGSGAFSLSGLFDLIPDIVPLIGDIFGSGATS